LNSLSVRKDFYMAKELSKVQWWCTLKDRAGNTEIVTEKKTIELALEVAEFSKDTLDILKEQLTLDKYVTKEEVVFDEDLILTHDFGKYKVDKNTGYVKAEGTKGKMAHAVIEEAFSEKKDPIIIPPSFGLRAYFSDDAGNTTFEIGSYATKLHWEATATYGKYEYGPDTNISAEDISWSISNSQTSDTAESLGESSVTKFFPLNGTARIRINEEDSKEYATVTGTYTVDASNAATPYNNFGQAGQGKIADMSGLISASAKVASYRKPFWSVLEAGKAISINNLDSEAVRGFSKSGTSTKGLPTILEVPVGTQMVIFAAKAGAYKNLTAKDQKSMNATINFVKIPNAVQVEGFDGFDAVYYDVWYIDWNPDNIADYKGIESAKLLSLAWS
jgi:hypothetical protein